MRLRTSWNVVGGIENPSKTGVIKGYVKTLDMTAFTCKWKSRVDEGVTLRLFTLVTYSKGDPLTTVLGRVIRSSLAIYGSLSNMMILHFLTWRSRPLSWLQEELPVCLNSV